MSSKDTHDQRRQAYLERQKLVVPKPRRSLKHLNVFKYQRHTKVFDGLDSDTNLQAMGAFMRNLKAGSEHVEVQSPKHWEKTDIVKTPKKMPRVVTRTCYTLRWYTRKDLGAKKVVVNG